MDFVVLYVSGRYTTLYYLPLWIDVIYLPMILMLVSLSRGQSYDSPSAYEIYKVNTHPSMA